MSVRSGILAVLSLGAAYGSQVHGELESRTNRAGRINVGQIYSTLDRLQTQGSVRSAGMTEDGLPLYGLTADGRVEVEEWTTTTEPLLVWPDFVAHVLMVASLPDGPIEILIENYRLVLDAEEGGSPLDGDTDPLAGLGDAASGILTRSALDWLDTVELALREPSALSRPLGVMRPRRGRRPRTPSA